MARRSGGGMTVAEAEFTRQETLLRQNVSAQNTYDIAKAKRDSTAASVQNNEANLVIAQTNLGYTKVTAPFDGIVTNHLVSVGELVGSSTATKYGPEFFGRIGKKGGKAVTAKYGPGHFERIGRKGGQKVADLIERAKSMESESPRPLETVVVEEPVEEEVGR